MPLSRGCGRRNGVSVCVDDFGENGSECFTEGTVIYINQQHPLYQRELKKPETYILNVTRLITQEIALMKDTRNPRLAFSRQSKLLRDAFVGTHPHELPGPKIIFLPVRLQLHAGLCFAIKIL